MSVRRKRLIFAAVMTVVIVTGFWLIQSEDSPLRHYFLYHTAAMGCVSIVNVVPLIVAFVAGGNVHQPSEIAFFIAAAAQWFALSYLFGRLIFPDDATR